MSLNISNELQSLLLESKRKHPMVREACELCLKEESISHLFKLQSLALMSGNQKLCVLSLVIYLKLFLNQQIPDEKNLIQETIHLLSFCVQSSHDVQLKVIQICLALVRLYTCVEDQVLWNLLNLICHLLQSKEQDVQNSASVLIRQLCMFLYEKNPTDAKKLFFELCLCAMNEKSQFQINRLLSLELIEQCLQFEKDLQIHFFPMIIKLLSEKVDFFICVRLFRCILFFLKLDFVMEVEIILKLILKTFSSEQDWFKCLCLEMFEALFLNKKTLVLFFTRFDLGKETSNIVFDVLLTCQKEIFKIKNKQEIESKTPLMSQIDKLELNNTNYLNFLSIQVFMALSLNLTEEMHNLFPLILEILRHLTFVDVDKVLILMLKLTNDVMRNEVIQLFSQKNIMHLCEFVSLNHDQINESWIHVLNLVREFNPNFDIFEDDFKSLQYLVDALIQMDPSEYKVQKLKEMCLMYDYEEIIQKAMVFLQNSPETLIFLIPKKFKKFPNQMLNLLQKLQNPYETLLICIRENGSVIQNFLLVHEILQKSQEKIAFECLEQICTEYPHMQPFESLIKTLSLFILQKNINVSLTCIRLLWNKHDENEVLYMFQELKPILLDQRQEIRQSLVIGFFRFNFFSVCLSLVEFVFESEFQDTKFLCLDLLAKLKLIPKSSKLLQLLQKFESHESTAKCLKIMKIDLQNLMLFLNQQSHNSLVIFLEMLEQNKNDTICLFCLQKFIECCSRSKVNLNVQIKDLLLSFMDSKQHDVLNVIMFVLKNSPTDLKSILLQNLQFTNNSNLNQFLKSLKPFLESDVLHLEATRVLIHALDFAVEFDEILELSQLFLSSRKNASLTLVQHDVKIVQQLCTHLVPKLQDEQRIMFFQSLEQSSRFLNPNPATVREEYCMSSLRILFQNKSALPVAMERTKSVLELYIHDKKSCSMPLPRLRELEVLVIFQHLATIDEFHTPFNPSASHLFSIYPILVNCIKYMQDQPITLDWVCRCLLRVIE